MKICCIYTSHFRTFTSVACRSRPIIVVLRWHLAKSDCLWRVTRNDRSVADNKSHTRVSNIRGKHRSPHRRYPSRPPSIYSSTKKPPEVTGASIHAWGPPLSHKQTRRMRSRQEEGRERPQIQTSRGMPFRAAKCGQCLQAGRRRCEHPHEGRALAARSHKLRPDTGKRA